jgi:pimeloyl-ACP methyl ester carboxylesterase
MSEPVKPSRRRVTRPVSGLGEEVQMLWGKLNPGPHYVGFRSVWELDTSRPYNMIFEDKTAYASEKSPRPILINIWYPARGPNETRPMRHRDYLAIETEDPRLARFAAELVEFERSTACREMMGKSAADLSDAEQKLLDEFWASPTASFRDAPPDEGVFPLVVYHSGAGSSFEDNAVLCEFLASHGYVIVGSVFQDQKGRSFNIDVVRASSRDMAFLIAYARQLPFVHRDHAGLVGHSAGAQAALVFRSLTRSPVDAVVSLDTTQDYFSLASPGWEYLTKRVLKNPRNMNGPLLMVANSHAIFQLADSLVHADRYYLTFNGLDHNDFISQGIVRRILESRANPERTDLRSSLEMARAGYEAMCECVLEFFDACLKDRTTDRGALLERYRSNPLGGPAPHVEHVPPGLAGPEPFRDRSNTAPTPRQLRPLLAARGIESMIALLKNHHAKDSASTVFHKDFGHALVDELLETQQIPEAVEFYQFYKAIDQDIASTYAEEGDLMRSFNATKEALRHYKKALLLDPANEAAIRGMKALQESKTRRTTPRPVVTD